MGLLIIVSPWKANTMTSVSNSPVVVVLPNFGRNLFWKHSVPFFLIRAMRVGTHPVSGITTNSRTDRNSVLHGTEISLIPSRNFTMGTKPTSMIKSFVATCTTV